MTALGELIGIDERTVLVLGQELDVERGQPDVGNALVHRAGEILVVVDTGVTEAFRAALREAMDRVGPWSRVLVLTTHGHPDHVGNNDLADGLGVPVEHWVPAPDLDQMRDPASYWVRAFERVEGWRRCPLPQSRAPRWCRCSGRTGPSRRAPAPTRSVRWSGSGSARRASPAGPSPTARSACCAARVTVPGT
ncbi:MBL fold metallo-hydrolase [Streptomyces sp. NPDC051704]|uniref:MBL fold metallo-hydrolase n=1 Tax=Streptomyces sp. NPDC051704 TaxID=3365671 RepID=UPI0037AED457